MPESRINLSAPSSSLDNFYELCFARTTNAHPRPVIQQYLQRLDVIDGLTAHQRMYATGIVTNHPAKRASTVRGRVRRKSELVRFRFPSQRVKHHARLYRRHPPGGIDPQNRRHVFGKVEHDGDVAALTGKACSTAARKHRRAVLSTSGNRGYHIIAVTREHEPDRNLSVIRSVCRIQRAGRIIKPDFALHRSL